MVVERWFRFEFDEAVDVVAHSEEHGYNLIPAKGMTQEELGGVGVRGSEGGLTAACRVAARLLPHELR